MFSDFGKALQTFGDMLLHYLNANPTQQHMFTNNLFQPSSFFPNSWVVKSLNLRHVWSSQEKLHEWSSFFFTGPKDVNDVM